MSLRSFEECCTFGVQFWIMEFSCEGMEMIGCNVSKTGTISLCLQVKGVAFPRTICHSRCIVCDSFWTHKCMIISYEINMNLHILLCVLECVCVWRKGGGSCPGFPALILHVSAYYGQRRSRDICRGVCRWSETFKQVKCK